MMMDQASDTHPHPPRCDYAACDVPAREFADGWWFCPQHRVEHDYIVAGLDLPDIPRRLLPVSCGTASGYRTHQRRGETPCLECTEASRVKAMLYNERTDRWHRRSA